MYRGWDADLAASAEAAGATILDDSSPVHSMRFDSPEHCFEVPIFPNLYIESMLHVYSPTLIIQRFLRARNPGCAHVMVSLSETGHFSFLILHASDESCSIATYCILLVLCNGMHIMFSFLLWF